MLIVVFKTFAKVVCVLKTFFSLLITDKKNSSNLPSWKISHKYFLGGKRQRLVYIKRFSA